MCHRKKRERSVFLFKTVELWGAKRPLGSPSGGFGVASAVATRTTKQTTCAQHREDDWKAWTGQSEDIPPVKMSVRVIARIRSLLESENEKDAIVEAAGADAASSARLSVVKIPSPKNFSEDFTFQFNGVYGQQSTQQELFDEEGKLTGFSHSLTLN